MQAPILKQLSDGTGRYACAYKHPDGSTSNFVGTYEEILTKMAIAHQNATDALSRSRNQQQQNARVAAEAVAQANAEKIINQWIRNASAEFGGDFYVCEANNAVILGWLQDRQLAVTVSNLSMALRDLMAHNALAPAPNVQEPIEELPLTEVPVPGHPGNSVSTIKQLRAMTNLRELVDITKYRPEVIAAWKQRQSEIISRGV